LRALLGTEITPATAHVLDGVQRLAAPPLLLFSSDSKEQSSQSRTACVASQVLDNLYFAHVRLQWNRLLRNPTATTNEDNNDVVRKGAVLLAQVCIRYSVLRRTTNLASFDKDIEESVTIYAKHVRLGLVHLYGAET
jgi:hypothetical protein